MQPRKLNVCIARFPYAGNGATSSEIPEIGDWLINNVAKMKADPRIENVSGIRLSDTPITMTRNRAVLSARQMGADLLLMIDSDNAPDIYEGSPDWKPFWDSSFEFIYKHWERGPHVVFAPYCGPPPGPYGGSENVYVFKWMNYETGFPSDSFAIEQFSRDEAAILSGIQPCAAGPTGCILFDMRAFELTDPKNTGDKPWFYYEWKDIYQSEKASTEDVTALRDISLAGQLTYGYNPVFCNWDAWAGHAKPKMVGKPEQITTSDVAAKIRRCVEVGRGRADKRVLMGDGHRMEVSPEAKLAPPENREKSASFEPHPEFEYCEHVTPAKDVEVLQGLVRSLGENPQVLEVGTYAGATAIAMAQAGALVTCVDHFGGSDWLTGPAGKLDVHAALQRNAERCGVADKLGIHIADSLAAAQEYEDGEFDLIYLDAGHEYGDVMRDIAAWRPKVRPGGILCGHDYSVAFPGVIRAVLEEFGNQFTFKARVWIHRVPVEAPAEEVHHTNGELIPSL